MEDGKCADAMAATGVPPTLRRYEGFLWEGSSWVLGRGEGVEGNRQGAGLDFTESYWLARYYGFQEGGAGHVLAWKDVTGPCAQE